MINKPTELQQQAEATRGSSQCQPSLYWSMKPPKHRDAKQETPEQHEIIMNINLRQA